MALYSQLESARSTAAAGDFSQGRAAYCRVSEAARRAAAAVAGDPALSQAWATFLGNLREEQELLEAWEAECRELEEPAVPSSQEAAAGRHGRALSGSSSGGSGSAGQAAAAFNVDLHSFEMAELPPARPAAGATAAGGGLSPAASVDPDVWSPADPAATAAAPRLSGYARGNQRREREEAYERARRDSLTPGAAHCTAARCLSLPVCIERLQALSLPTACLLCPSSWQARPAAAGEAGPPPPPSPASSRASTRAPSAATAAAAAVDALEET